jgi:penicillin-binding protein 2
MYGVVNEEHGTATNVKLSGIEFSGKSGTAQIINYDLRSRLGKVKQFKDNSWFVGYAPRRNPEIVVAVLVQAGGHGSEAAAPVVRDIIKAYYDKKAKKDGQITADSGTAPKTAPPVAPAQPKRAPKAPATTAAVGEIPITDPQDPR